MQPFAKALRDFPVFRGSGTSRSKGRRNLLPHGLGDDVTGLLLVITGAVNRTGIDCVLFYDSDGYQLLLIEYNNYSALCE